ncbi:hypothetical protein MED121_06555 [Marinomonas sp. MED121]|nr:hypothetical protein MED121_06555 [Marinomonas sp. MED121]
MLFIENEGGLLCSFKHRLAGMKDHKYFMPNTASYQDDFNH